MEGPFGLARGELVAVDVPPGPAWVRLVRQLWSDRVAFLPLDDRLTERDRRALVDLARPTAVLDAAGSLTVFAGGAPVDDEVALVMATSGTGGTPRLVELSRGSVTAAAEASRDALAAAGHDVSAPLVCCLTPAHIGGLLVLLRGELGDLRVVVHDRFEPRRLLREAPAGAGVSLVPTMLRRLVHAGADLARLGTLLVGGAALDGDLHASAVALGGRVVSTYGLTESCGGVVYDGVPLPGTRVRIGEAGRIDLHGLTLMQGYRGDPAATGATFDTQGWMRTDDAGSIADDGRVVVYGRLDEAIRTGGETVWPDEVERALADHPKVADVAVAARPHPEWGEQVVAFVVPRRIDEPPTLDELRDHAADSIARHKAPRDLVLVSELPRTAGGKIRRGELRA
ncbi:MAG: class I adenylate-forming enzyme family protein [Actinomycetota bacterium]